MARQARIKNDFGIFYIQQISGDEQVLFRSDEDRRYFVDLIHQGAQNFQFELISYCAVSEREYHLVLRLNGSDLSKIMKSINISYAMYRKESHHLYKDRYKSQWVENEEALKLLLAKLHCEGKAESPWNQFCKLVQSSAPCEECIKAVDQAQHWLTQKCQAENLEFSKVLKDKPLRNDWILQLRKKSTLSLKEIGEIFGGISESSVCKIIKDCH